MAFLRKLCLGGVRGGQEEIEPGVTGANGSISFEKKNPSYESLNEFIQMKIIGKFFC